MKNQYKLPLILFLIGMIFTIIGSLFKLMHWSGAGFLLITGMLTKVVAIVILIILLVKK